MMDERPAVPAEEVEAVEDSGSVQAEAGVWALPEAGSITLCPKCRGARLGEEVLGVLRIVYHQQQIPCDLTKPIEEQVKRAPCMALGFELFPPSGKIGIGGEHLCIQCTRCGFSWVEQVARRENIYWQEPPSEDEE